MWGNMQLLVIGLGGRVRRQAADLWTDWLTDFKHVGRQLASHTHQQTVVHGCKSGACTHQPPGKAANHQVQQINWQTDPQPSWRTCGWVVRPHLGGVDGPQVGGVLEEGGAEVNGDVVGGGNLVRSRPLGEQVAGANPGVLLVAPHQLLDARPPHALHEAPLHLVHRRVGHICGSLVLP